MHKEGYVRQTSVTQNQNIRQKRVFPSEINIPSQTKPNQTKTKQKTNYNGIYVFCMGIGKKGAGGPGGGGGGGEGGGVFTVDFD